MNIKIVICFIIIPFLPAVSAMTDNVWVAKTSGFIESGSSLSFQNYNIIAKVINDTEAEITVSRNWKEIGTSTIHINEIKKYGETGIILLGIKGDVAWISVSKLEDKDIWKLLEIKQLKWGEKYTTGNYTISIDTFGTDSVRLEISNSSTTRMYDFLENSSENFEDIRIGVGSINKTGFIELEILTRKSPVVKADIFTDKDEYFPDETVRVVVNATGDDYLNVIGMELETDTDTVIRSGMVSLTDINGTVSFRSNISRLPANSIINIRAVIESRDYYNKKYITSVNRSVRSTPVVSITKRVPPESDEENITVELHIHNAAPTVEFISVYDTIPRELTLQQLDWRIRLDPGASRVLTYPVSPQEPGLYTLPPAVVKWKKNSSSSGQATVTVHRPYVVTTRSQVIDRGLTAIELNIRNTGDRPAQVTVSDEIPDGYPVVSGKTTWSGFLEGGESTTIMYTLQGNIENLPPSNVTYRDIHGVIREAQTKITELRMIDPHDDPEPEKTASLINAEPYDIVSFMVSSFIVIAGIICGIAMTACLFIRSNEG